MKPEPLEPGPVEAFSEYFYPKTAAAYWSMFAMLETGALVLATPIVLAATWPLLSSILIGYAIAAFWTVPVCLIFAGTQNGYLYRKSGRVEFDGENIRLFAAPDGVFPDFEAKPAECRWFHGNRSWATFGSADSRWGSANDLLLVLPEEYRTRQPRWGRWVYDESPVIVCLGKTPEARARWEDLIYRSGMVHDESYENYPAPISEGFASACILTVLFASFPLFLYLASFIERFLNGFGVSDEIARGIGFPFFVPGCLLIFLNVVFLFCRWQRRQTVKRVVEQIEAVKPARIVFSYIIILAYILVPLCIPDPKERYSPDFKIAVAVTTLLLTAASLFVSLRLIASPPPKPENERDELETDEFTKYSGHFNDKAYE